MAVEPAWPVFFVGSRDFRGASVEELLPSVPLPSLSLVEDWDRDRDVRTCEVLLCLLTWDVLKSMDSSVEEPLLSAFPCPDWFGLALAASLTWALSTAWGDSRVMVTVGSKVFFPVTVEELRAKVVAVVVVTTAIVTAGLDVVTVVVVEGGAPVLPRGARGTTVFA